MRSARKIKTEEAIKSPVYRIVGENIRKLRKSKKWTQGDLARMTGYSVGSILNFEKGVQRVPLETLEIVAKTLGVPIMILFTEDSSSEVRYWKNRCIEAERKYQTLKMSASELSELLMKLQRDLL